MEKQSLVIGRAGDITLYDDTVSRQHAVLEIDDTGMFLRDMDSRNGTYEIKDKKLVPFRAGPVFADQVFAFGECVRSIAQLLKEAGVGGDRLSDTSVPAGPDDDFDPLDQTQIGFKVPTRRRLSRANIVDMLDQIEDHLGDGGDLESICETLGITEQRYERWCREHGATREEREKSMADLQRENTRLRKLVADLSLERDELRDALVAAGGEPPGDDNADDAPSFSLVSGDPDSR